MRKKGPHLDPLIPLSQLIPLKINPMTKLRLLVRLIKIKAEYYIDI